MSTNMQGFNRFMAKLNKVNDMVKTDSYILKRIVEEVALQGQLYLNSLYNTLSLDDTSMNPIPIVTTEIINNKGYIKANGKGVAFIEFGTGNVGKETATADTLKNKAKVGASDYNSGKTIKKMRVAKGYTKTGNVRYGKDLAWVKPRYAMTSSEVISLDNYVAKVSYILGGSRLNNAIRRQEKFIRRTQGIVAGNQIYETAIYLKGEIPKIVKRVVKEELGK